MCAGARVCAVVISTHAPRTGSDTAEIIFDCAYNISTHAPRTGSDKYMGIWEQFPFTFQPTLPARGATKFCFNLPHVGKFQPTLPARGATRRVKSINGNAVFQPTLPARGATLSDGFCKSL